MTTPVRRQYLQLKQQHPDALLFFRMGDFYEAFDEDAEIIAKTLNIVLTARDAGKGKKTPMAGVPHHAAEAYIARLIKAGFKVAICEQVGKEAIKGLMPREVVRVVTPGTVIEPELLEAKQNNYLAALIWDQNQAGLAYVDITTGDFACTQLKGEEPERLAFDELNRLNPAEVLLPENFESEFVKQAYHLTPLESWRFEEAQASQSLLTHFEVSTLEGFGLSGKGLAIQAAGAILQYLQKTHKANLQQISSLRVYNTASFMVIDRNTRRNLELTETMRGQGKQGALVNVLDETNTPMGGRLLRTWIQQPLLDVQALNQRLDAVEAFHASTRLRAEVETHLKGISDIERLISRIVQGIAQPKNLVDLRQSLAKLPDLIDHLSEAAPLPLQNLGQALDPCTAVYKLLDQAIVDEPPSLISKGNAIRPSFSPELSELLEDSREAREWIANLEQTEQARTGLPKLKVGFNKVFGYYLEVSKSNLDYVPPDYIRKQTLVNAERFITPELKEYETLLLNAEERQIEIESRIFQEVLAQVAAHRKAVYQTAQTLAKLDVYLALGQIAAQNRYVRPVLDDGDTIDIREGRHPVVEHSLGYGGVQAFVPNDTHLSAEALIWIITGPNMAGKSTFLRQVALIVLMAQIGSFVPAEKAHIGLVDRIFTRIGAQDEIHAGQSTFMVEMVETAALLSQSSARSLLILDEIGRGTSTYDGLAIARAILEHIHNSPQLRARTLFATHYHELVALEKYLPHVRNYNVAISDKGQDIVFLHKLLPGGADRSYGVHVAQLAGIPKAVINRAQEILSELEGSTVLQKQRQQLRDAFSAHQLSFFSEEAHPLVEALKTLEIDQLSPLEALNKLYELQKEAREAD